METLEISLAASEQRKRRCYKGTSVLKRRPIPESPPGGAELLGRGVVESAIGGKHG
jgi:hypothetical protein